MNYAYRKRFAWSPVKAYQGDGITRKVWLCFVMAYDTNGKTYYFSIEYYRKLISEQ